MIIKPKNDKNTYNNFTLDNGIEIINVCDTEAVNSTITVSVHVGQLQDPVNMQGLAHFLEHMLFMGSKKYPKENYFSDFISKNNGHSNAFTSNEHTTYFFSIDSSVFEEAMDILSQFFKEPLISENSLEREINAVNSEHIKNFPNHHRRLYQVLKEIAEDGSEMKKYGCGTKDSLSSPFIKNNIVNYKKMRKAIVDFYNEYYVSSNIKIVTVSNLKISKQKEYINKHFNSIKKQPKKNIPEYKQPYLLSNKDCYKLVNIKALDDNNKLLLTWFFNKNIYNVHINNFIINIIGDETKNSITNELYSNGYISQLNTGSSYSDKKIFMIDINILLTDKGSMNKNIIINTIISYINKFKKITIEQFKSLYEQYITINNINFDSSEKIKDTNLALMITSNVKDYDIKYCLGGFFKDINFNEESFRRFYKFINSFNKENMIVFNLSKNIKTNKNERWLDVEYKIEKNVKYVSEDINFTLELPKLNIYVPDNLNIIKSDINSINKLNDNSYYRTTSQFNSPKGIILTVFFLKNNLSNEERVLLNMYLNSKSEEIHKVFYDAMDIGNNINISTYNENYPNCNYFTVSSEGFTNKLESLHENVLKLIFNNQISDIYFDTNKFNTLKDIKNFKLLEPYKYMVTIIKSIINKNYQFPDDLKPFVDKADVNKCINFFKSIELSQLNFYYGNFNKKNINTFTNYSKFNIDVNNLFTIKDTVKHKKIYTKELLTKKIKEDCLCYFIDCGVISQNNYIDIYPYVDLLNICLSNTFFEFIRTKNEVGYIVFNKVSIYGSTTEPRLIWFFIAQSGVKTIDEMDKLFNEYFNDIHKILEDSKSFFKQTKKNYINQILEPEYSYLQFLEDDTETLFKIIPENYKEKLLNKVKLIKHSDIMDFYKKLSEPSKIMLKKLT